MPLKSWDISRFVATVFDLPVVAAVIATSSKEYILSLCILLCLVQVASSVEQAELWNEWVGCVVSIVTLWFNQEPDQPVATDCYYTKLTRIFNVGVFYIL